MPTKNTLQDIQSAEGYLDYVSRRAINAIDQVRASYLLSIIRMMDHHYPGWREQLIESLDRADITKDVRYLFLLDQMDDGYLYSTFLQSALTKSTSKLDNGGNDDRPK